MQKAIIVDNYLIDELNSLLGQGWKVIRTESMPSSTHSNSIHRLHDSYPPTCLVILEKEKNAKYDVANEKML